jgi:hypothetical protein
VELPATRFTSLLRIAEEQLSAPAEPWKIPVWSLAENHRPVLFEQAPGRIELHGLPVGPDCTLRFDHR